MAAWLADLWPNYVNDKRQIVGYFNWCENNHYISIYPAPAWPSRSGPLIVMFGDWNEVKKLQPSPQFQLSLPPASSLLPRAEYVEDERVAHGSQWFTVQSLPGWHQPRLTCKPAIRAEISSEAVIIIITALTVRLSWRYVRCKVRCKVA